jgi:DNA-binding Xre family transcriptional regulator
MEGEEAMTTLTGAAERPTKTAIRRPASGVAIDPAKLIAMRSRRSLSRLQLSVLTAQRDPEGNGISRDAIAKIENGQRRPKTATLAMLCDALDCTPEELLPKRR